MFQLKTIFYHVSRAWEIIMAWSVCVCVRVYVSREDVGGKREKKKRYRERERDHRNSTEWRVP